MQTLMYNDSIEFIHELMRYAAHGEEVEVPCPNCGRPLLVAVTREKASALGIHPGVYCAVSRGHVYRVLSLTEPRGPAGGSWVDKLQGK